MPISHSGEFFFFLSLFIFAISLECNIEEVSFEVSPPNALSLVKRDIKLTSTESYYVVEKGTTNFSISCTSTLPVGWTVFKTKVYQGVQEIFSTDRNYINSTDGAEAYNTICYTSRLTFYEITENLTAQFYCSFSYESIRSTVNFPSVYIYGAYGNESGLLINRGQRYLYETDDYDSRQVYWKEMVIPCKTSFPSPVEVTVNPKPGLLDYQIEVPTQVCFDGNTPCIDLNAIVYNHTIISPNQGFNLRCSIKNSSLLNDVVDVAVLPSPEFTVYPKEVQTVLFAYDKQLFKFICRSLKYVTIQTTVNFSFTVTTSLSFDRYYSYESEMKLYIPETHGSFYPVDTNGEIHTHNAVISCVEGQNGNTLHTWNYTFESQYRGSDDMNEKKIKLEKRGNNTFACLTSFWSSFSVHYVPCSTYIECQMRAELLSNDSYRIQSYDPDPFEVKFVLPLKKSGMVKCIGFQEEIFAIAYIGLYQQFYVLASSPNEYWFVKTLLAHSNESEIFEGGVIAVNCTAPLMLVRGLLYWTFKFRNDTSDVVNQDLIVEQNCSWKNEMHTNFAKLRVPNVDIIEIVCMSLQYATMPHIILEEGLFKNIGPNDNITLLKYSLPISVKAKPFVKEPESRIGLILGIIFGILFVITTIITTLVALRLKAKNNFIDKLREEEIEFFLNGRLELISPDQDSNTNAKNSAYDASKEISFDKLHIDYSSILGCGEFGIVFKAALSVELNKTLMVAVKSVKPGACVDYLRATMEELKVLIFIKTHENVVELIGACTQNLIHHELFVVMEYCENGSLLNYLRDNCESFVNQVVRGCVQSKLTLNTENCNFTTEMLIHWAFQIANGMKYISNLNVIHGDLAARNVLLDAKLTAKICDFGLSKKLYVFTQYVRSPTIPIPWRYLAVESLTFKEFSLSSDVWAFGVTIWELFTMGAVPYPGLEYGTEFIKMLTAGFRLPLPEFSSYEIYNIILNCWHKDPHGRPRFTNICDQFETMISEIQTTKEKYISMDAERQRSALKNETQMKSPEVDLIDFSMDYVSDLDYSSISEQQCQNSGTEYLTVGDI